jgi:hypothetical protein
MPGATSSKSIEGPEAKINILKVSKKIESDECFKKKFFLYLIM